MVADVLTRARVAVTVMVRLTPVWVMRPQRVLLPLLGLSSADVRDAPACCGVIATTVAARVAIVRVRMMRRILIIMQSLRASIAMVCASTCVAMVSM